ncbi:MAG: cytochrome c3 family protein, partial [Thermoanaerobaculia bacterium]
MPLHHHPLRDAMRFVVRFAIVSTLLFAVASPVYAAKPKRKLVSKECVECHKPIQALASKKVVHEPFRDSKGCETCHKRHGVVGTLVLLQEEPELCFQCHDQQKTELASAHVHAPVKDGKCTQCHNPHAGDSKALLIATGNEACFTCHEQKNFTEGSVHAPVSTNCLVCHGAHASAEPNLLIKSADALCTSCHGK